MVFFILLGMIATIVLVALIPTDNPAGKFWFICIATSFAILLAIAMVYGWLQKRMVQEMKAPSPEVPRMPDPPRQEKTTPPPHPFEYILFDRETPVQMSPGGVEMLNRTKSIQERIKPNMMYAAFFIWLCYLPVAVGYFIAPRVLPGSTIIFCGILPTLLVAWLTNNPKKTSAEMTILIWGGLNVAGIGVIVIGMLSTLFHLLMDRGTVLEIMRLVLILIISASALLAYALFNLYLGNRSKSQISASKPMRLLILWVFGPQKNLLKILDNIGRYWRLIGSVQFLQGGEYTLDMSQVVSYIGGNRKILTRTREQLDEKLQSFKYTPGWDGIYPSHSLLCGDVVWKLAIDYFLSNANVVAMNLCGFSRSNQGCLYELGLLVDRFPSQRILFLADETTDMDFLITTLKQKWDTMPAISPNHIVSAAPIRIYKLFSGVQAFTEALHAMGATTDDKEAIKKLLNNRAGLNAIQSRVGGDNENMLKLFFETAATPLA